jgi:hypothetical protein
MSYPMSAAGCKRLPCGPAFSPYCAAALNVEEERR